MTKKRSRYWTEKESWLGADTEWFLVTLGVVPADRDLYAFPASLGGIFLFDWLEPVCSLLFFPPPWSCVTAGSGLSIEVNVFVLTRHF